MRIREYGEGYSVEIGRRNSRDVIRASNEGGFNCTEVDLIDVLKYVKKEMPELLKDII